MRRVKNIDYVLDVSKIVEILLSRADEDDIAEFHITTTNPYVYFNQELAAQFKEWLKKGGYVDKFYDTG